MAGPALKLKIRWDIRLALLPLTFEIIEDRCASLADQRLGKVTLDADELIVAARLENTKQRAVVALPALARRDAADFVRHMHMRDQRQCLGEVVQRIVLHPEMICIEQQAKVGQ